MIGEVDAVLIATDKGDEHVQRCRRFVEHGIPVFVDKPLADNEADLDTFYGWVAQGSRILSSSCMRYCREYASFRDSLASLGQLRYATITTCKTWERYGIHALEGIYPIVGPGFLSCRNTGTKERNMVHLKHKSGTDIVAVAIADMSGSFGVLTLCGTRSSAHAVMTDSFYAFREQLRGFVHYLRSGIRPFPFSETVELVRLLIAGCRSREEGGREVALAEISAGLPAR
jgi:predicted dehydrogenase